MSGNNDKIHSAAIDEDYTDMNCPMIAQKCLNIILDMPQSTIRKKYMKLLRKFHLVKWNINMVLTKNEYTLLFQNISNAYGIVRELKNTT